ncbi:hypothetical protein ACIQ7D_17830 [Streptomyces sp. NPDC096310]|uniref:DUF6197 family protein n=1 Tax=Streptomyces sp. NPDC096310 TaxID=3366082 RepID=UPI003829F894
MTTITYAPTSPPTVAAPELDLDTRLALAETAMTVRLDHALLAYAVNTAHLPDAPLAEPIAPALPPAVIVPAIRPLGSVFLDALRIIDTRGWTRSTLRDDTGAVCVVGALRAAATRRQADDACVLLLDVIRQRYQAETVPSWNDAQTSAEPIRWALTTAHNRTATHGV